MPTEHDIITHDGIEIVIKMVVENHLMFTAYSDSERFLAIFGVNELKIEGDGSDLQYWIEDNVEPENQTKAVEIMTLILNAI